MTQHTNESEPQQLEQQWQAALSRVDGILARNNPDASDSEMADLKTQAEQTVLNLAGSDKLKLVVTTTEDQHQERTIEPDWAETPGFGVPASTYAEIMGLEDSTSYDHLDPLSVGYLQSIADSAQKPVSALLDGQYVEPINPVAKAA